MQTSLHGFSKNHRSPEAWDRFKRDILEYGDSRDELKVLEGFLGRPVTLKTFASESWLVDSL